MGENGYGSGINMCFFAGKAAQLTVFSVAGTFNLQVALATLPLAAIGAAGLLLGQLVHQRINLVLFRKIIKFVLLLLGIILVQQVVSSYGVFATS